MSLRARLMIIGLAGVGIALIMGGLAFFGALTYSVNRTLDNEALASAQEVAAMVNENRLPSPIPVSGAQVVQVVDSQQRVIGGSVTADRLTPLLRPHELATALSRRGGRRRRRTRSASRGRCGSEPSAQDPQTAPVSVIVGSAVSAMCSPRVRRSGTRCSLRFHCCSGLWRAIAWRVIGWTLRPVEQLRAGAEQISTNAPDQWSGRERTAPSTIGSGRDPRSRGHPQ